MILDWPDCRNVRDLGYLRSADGDRLRPGALLRSDGHHRLTGSAVQAVRDSGVRRIVDLRWARECAAHPSPFVNDASYRHSPLLNDVLDYDPPAETYGPMLDHNRQRIAAAFRLVAKAPPGGVVVHCTAGRDRTGVLVALLLSVAGATADDIADDYACTEGCTPTPMRNTLRHLTHHYGGSTPYLVQAGVAPGLLDAVRDRLRA